MVFLQVVYSVVWLGKYDFTNQEVILFVFPQAGFHLLVKRIPHMKGKVLSGSVWPIICNSEMGNYSIIAIMASFCSLNLV